MRNISDTITRLSALRPRQGGAVGGHSSNRLSELTDFGSNPGALRARTFIPDELPEAAPLVVVLHGCTQDAAAYDHGSGWSDLAERNGFAVLYPEQQRANNVNLCFNWFVPADTKRDSGEALSIRQMIEALIVKHGLDRKRIFVTGLSAGGAMAASMLATYPETFAGGAIIAGLPHGCAGTVPEAFDRMRGHGLPSERELQALVRSASKHDGPWPTLSIWHGAADRTVAPPNMDAIVGQWRKLHALKAAPSKTETVDGHSRRVWRDANGRDAIEAYSVAGMGHGTPLKVAGDGGLGAAGPFMLDVGISSTLRIADFWGLAGGQARTVRKSPAVSDAETPIDVVGTKRPKAKRIEVEPNAPRPTGIGKIIDDALRAAGLMR